MEERAIGQRETLGDVVPWTMLISLCFFFDCSSLELRRLGPDLGLALDERRVSNGMMDDG